MIRPDGTPTIAECFQTITHSKSRTGSAPLPTGEPDGERAGLVHAQLEDGQLTGRGPVAPGPAGHRHPLLRRVGDGAGCDYWATDPPLARAVVAFAVADPAAGDLLAGHDAGRLRLLTRLVDRLAAAGRLGCSPGHALDTLWLLTGFAAYDELARGRDLPTAEIAALLGDLAETRLSAGSG